MSRSTIQHACLAAALVLAAGCSKPASESASKSSESTAQTSQAASDNGPVDVASAKEMFDARCAACHGTEGRGNGPGAVALNPKPRNYHDKEWQAKVSDEDIKKTIQYGGAAVGKSPMMPASPDLDAKPAVVSGLVRIVRDFGKVP